MGNKFWHDIVYDNTTKAIRFVFVDGVQVCLPIASLRKWMPPSHVIDEEFLELQQRNDIRLNNVAGVVFLDPIMVLGEYDLLAKWFVDFFYVRFERAHISEIRRKAGSRPKGITSVENGKKGGRPKKGTQTASAN